MADLDFRVRAQAADNLTTSPAARAALQSLAADPHPTGRYSTEAALRWIDRRRAERLG